MRALFLLAEGHNTEKTILLTIARGSISPSSGTFTHSLGKVTRREDKFWLQTQKEGVSQGSIPLVIIFNQKINITKCLNPEIDDYLYVNNFCITTKFKYMSTAKCQLQQCIKKFNQWAIANSFKISNSKTRCMHFCQLRKMRNNLSLKLDRTEILVIDHFKFLGIIFNKKPTFILHLSKRQM